MFYYLFVIAVFAASANGESNNRIVGGSPAVIERYPYQVSLRDRRLNHFCAGSIVSNRVVLTAAHCIRGRPAAGIIVVAGGTFLTPAVVTRTVNRTLIHPLYNRNTMNWDAGLLTLSADLTFGPTIQSIALTATEPTAGTNASTTGWGATSEGGQGSNQLRVAFIPIVARAVCVGNYAPIGITPIMICAGEAGKDSCQGDAGGPLVVNRQLVGIVSWGEGCARPNKPGVYTNAARLRPWVAANI